MKKLFLVICAFLVPVMTVAKGPSPECLIDKYGRYARAQETWQKNLAKLVVEVAPRYEEAAQRYLTDQLRAIELARRAVKFLVHEEPGKLRTQRSLNNWLGLDEADRERIAARDDEYAKLLERHQAAGKRPPHPDGDGLREVMRAEVVESEKYRQVQRVFSHSVQAAEEIQCQ